MTWLQANRDDLRMRMLREPRGYPAANCNLVLPSSNPEADAGYVIMEHVEYPGMSGTNTICVVTALLETGMLPMTEPVTELTLEAPAGLIRVRADCADGKVTGVTFRNVPASRRISTPRSRSRSSAPSPSTSRTAGCSTSSPTAEPFGLRLTPDEGGDIARITEMIKAAANEQFPVVHPEQPGFAGITIGQLSGPAHDPANRCERRHGLDRDARLGRPVDLDRRDRPIAVRHGDVGADGGAPRARAARDRRGLPARGDPRHGLHRADLEETRSGSTGAVVPRSPAAPGSPASPTTSSTRPIRSPTVSRSATSGSGAACRVGRRGVSASSEARTRSEDQARAGRGDDAIGRFPVLFAGRA